MNAVSNFKICHTVDFPVNFTGDDLCRGRISVAEMLTNWDYVVRDIVTFFPDGLVNEREDVSMID